MPIIFIDRSAPDSNDLAGLPDTSHCRGSTSEAANGGLSDRLSHIGRRAVGDHGRVDSVGPGFRVRNAGELVVGLTPRSDAHDALGSKRHFAKTSVRPRMFALDVAVDAPIEFGASRSSPEKNLCNNTYTERAGAIRSLENVNSIKLCLSLFAVRLEMLDLST